MSGVWYRGAARLPADIALAIIPSLPRAQLEQLVQRLIDRMDADDGDPDLESATDAEDDFSLSDQAIGYGSDGPGCSISDTDYAVDDVRCDDPDEDKEPEEPAIPVYGIDQTQTATAWRLT